MPSSRRIVLSRLLRLYFREAWNGHNLAFLGVMILLAALLLSGSQIGSGGKIEIYRPVRLSIVDDDKSLISYTLADQFADLSTVERIYVEDLTTALNRLANNEILLILVIPADFYEQTVQGGERSKLTVYLNEKMPAEAAVFVRLMQNMAGSVTAMQAALFAYMDLAQPLYDDPADFVNASSRASANLVFRLVGRQSLVRVDDSNQFATTRHIVSSIACLLAMLTGVLTLIHVQQERVHGLHERLLLAGVRGWQLILAKQFISMLWFIAGFAPLLAAFYRFAPGLDLWPVLFAVFALFWIMSLLAQGLAYLVRPGDTTLLAAWLGLFALLLLGGCIYPWPLLPAWLQVAGLVSPARWGYLLIYQTLAGQPVTASAFLVLAGMAVVATLVSLLALDRAQPVTD